MRLCTFCPAPSQCAPGAQAGTVALWALLSFISTAPVSTAAEDAPLGTHLQNNLKLRAITSSFWTKNKTCVKIWCLDHIVSTKSIKSSSIGNVSTMFDPSVSLCKGVNVLFFFSLSQSGSSEEVRRSLTVGVAGMVLSLLSSAWFPLDLSAHQAALLLAGNLLAGTNSFRLD